MLTVLSGLLSATSYAFSDLFSQCMSRRVGLTRVLVWVLTIGIVVVVPTALLVDGVPHGGAQWRAVGYSMGAGALYLGAYFTLLAALKVGDLSLVAVLSSLQGLFTTVFAIIGGEKVTPLLGLGLGLAIVGGALAAAQGRAKTARGSGWAVLSGLIFALTMVVFDRAGDISWLSQAAYSRLTSAVLFVPLAVVVLRRARSRRLGSAGTDENVAQTAAVANGAKADTVSAAAAGAAVVADAGGAVSDSPAADPAADPPTAHLPQADPAAPLSRSEALTCAAAGILELLGLVLITVSIQLGPLSVAGVTAAQFGTVAVILGLVLLKERPRKHQLVGVVFTMVAVSLLSAIG